MRRAWLMLVCLSLLAGCVSIANPGEPDAAAPSAAGVRPAAREDADATPATPLGERPHTHDYWEGAMSVTLLDEDVPVMIAHNHLFDEPPREQHTHGCDETLASDSQGGSRKFSLPEGIIVLPGTEQLSFLIDWTAPTITGLRLLVRPANQHDLLDAGIVTNGEPLLLPLTPEMVDMGHATRTSWVFFLCADGSSPASLAEGSVHANVMAMRAPELPLDPPHPDWWRDATEIELANLTATASGATVLNKGDAWIHVPLEHGQIVPSGTKSLHAHVQVRDNTPSADALPVIPILYYRDSTVPEWVYKTAEVVDDHLHIDVDHNMVDGVYAHESNWDFWVRLSSPQPTETPAGVMSEPRILDALLSIHIVAERDPPDA